MVTGLPTATRCLVWFLLLLYLLRPLVLLSVTLHVLVLVVYWSHFFAFQVDRRRADFD